MMKKTKFTGAGVAMVTPFDNDGQVDFLSLQKLIDFLIAGGIDYIVVLGTTGEAATLSQKEKAEILQCAVSRINGRVPIMYGIGGNNTREVINAVQTTDLSHVDGILSVVPFYNKPNQEGMYRHFSAIAEACPKEVVVYNVPGRTGVNILPETVVRLANNAANITAIKEACGNINQIMHLMNIKPADFTVISGDDGLTLPLMSVGVEGVISVAANVFPQLVSTMVHHAQQGQFGPAANIHYQLLNSIKLMFAEGNPCGIKEYMTQNSLITNNLRLPMIPASNELAAKISLDLKRYK